MFSIDIYTQGTTHSIAAVSSNEESSTIYIWSYSPQLPKGRQKHSSLKSIQVLFFLLVVLITSALSPVIDQKHLQSVTTSLTVRSTLLAF
jgi:hypothetical protein